MLFKPEMILACLNTKPNVWPAEPIDPAKPFKWQTRRAVKFPVFDRYGTGCEIAGCELNSCLQQGLEISPHIVGQVIYARETWQQDPVGEWGECYKATGHNPKCKVHGHIWRPAIHMPKAIARLWFVVKRVRVERVNAISEADARAEGVVVPDSIASDRVWHTAVEEYRKLFNSINGQGEFERGDWCWVYDLARISKP